VKGRTLLEAITLSEVSQVAEACNAVVQATAIPRSAGDIPVTVSTGAAQLPTTFHDTGCQELLGLADTQLYRAKQTGRNRFCS
jgi:diguanylate cyclase